MGFFGPLRKIVQMAPFSSAPHADVFHLLLQMGALLLTARLLGDLVQRLGQPAVIGELAAGILLGPSLLSGFFPEVASVMTPGATTQGYLLELIGLLGAMFLMVITGLELDLPLIRRHARTALGVSLCGVSVTFACGYVLGESLPDRFLVDPDQRHVFAMFLATAMSISAIPVLARVLFDLNLMRRDVGQTMIAAGMSDDAIGWTLLSIAVAMSSAGVAQPLEAGGIVLKTALFLVLSFTLGRWLVRRLTNWVQDRLAASDRALTLVMVVVFFFAALAQGLGFEAILGAFVAGALFGQVRRLPVSVHHQLHSVSSGIFSPIFFGIAGLKVDLRALGDPEILAGAGLIVLIATVGKFTGTFIGARFIGRRGFWYSLCFGAGLNARGAMEILVATIGLKAGIISGQMFSIIVVLAIATSMLSPPLLRLLVRKVKPEEDELRRLEQEEFRAESLIAGVQRVLLPVRVRPEGAGSANFIESILLRRLADDQSIAVTLLNVQSPETANRSEAQQFLKELAPLFAPAQVTQRYVEDRQAAETILEEAWRDYDLMVLGAPERNDASSVIFAPLVDYLVRFSPRPTLVVRGASVPSNWLPRRILAPTNGAAPARHAAELAFHIAAEGDCVYVMHVIQSRSALRPPAHLYAADERLRIGEDITNSLAEIGSKLGVLAETVVESAPEPETAIVEFARRERIDLIVLGTDLRPASNRLYLGQRVEYILANAPCPVVVFNAR